jgi:signal transduction histidine kinase
MAVNVAGELRKYRSLTIAMLAGTTVSVGMFVLFLTLDMEETRRDLGLESQLSAMSTANELEFAFATVTQIVNRLGAVAGSADGIRSVLFQNLAADSALATAMLQLCVFWSDTPDAVFRLNATAPCGTADDETVTASATARMADDREIELRVVAATDNPRDSYILGTALGDDRFRVEFRLSSLNLQSAPSAATGGVGAVLSCLYWTLSGTTSLVACNDEPGRQIDISPQSIFTRADVNVVPLTIPTLSADWLFASSLRPEQIAGSVSFLPIAVLLFFLGATGAVSWYAYTSTGANITLQLQQARLRTAFQELAKRNEELEQFAYMASHDLQTPLRHVISRATMLQEDLAENNYDRTLRNSQLIIDSSNRMQSFIIDLLEFCRAGEAALKLTDVDLATLVREQVRIVSDSYPMPDVRWNIGDLPRIRSDWSLLTQVFQNLLTNCAKFRNHGKPLTIDIGAEWDAVAKKWTMHVADNGVGIDVVQLDRIFLPFKRLHPELNQQGTGVGLSIVKKVVERLGGSVRAESQPGAGTTVYFELPAVYGGIEAGDGLRRAVAAGEETASRER